MFYQTNFNFKKRLKLKNFEMYQTTYTLVLHFVWYERNCEERVSKERS